ncbi:Na(+)/citrate cotransporter-like isoform X2 [Hydractinia symbiolongicarpus]|uniref:Na(+)/citrate cotransporter-like isoform X2 n=1 Tax=Hydractinia symbiolongicarpus TaxID=13093 RepID=UPI00254EEDAF|nr:Na(+)/citrate cotransporter-like isoform X2 [Hydractinia symbiolongicarpus]
MALVPLLKRFKRLLIFVLTPIIFAPLLIAVDSQETRAAYGIAIMAVYWVTEVTPLAVTSLLPLLIFPFLGVLKAKVVCMQYMKDTNILLLGGLLIAVAIEQWNVHKRVALAVLLLVGVQPRRLMLGFMMVTAFISMWITNTATTAMMTPIMEAVLKQLDKQHLHVAIEDESPDEKENIDDSIPTSARNGNFTKSIHEDDADLELQRLESGPENKNSDTCKNLVEEKTNTELEARHRTFCKAMLLCICYSANIGGTGTLTGTAPQLVLAGQMDDVFPNGPSISFIYWFVYAFPQMLLFLFLGWIYLQMMFMGVSFKHLCCCLRWKKRNTKKGGELYDVMKKQYKDLGPITFAEIMVLICFIVLVLLWFLREPKFMPGWGELFKKGYISDGTAAMIIAFLLFQIPSQVPICLNFWNTKRVNLPHKTLLEWNSVSKKFPWNVLFLLGAGFALAKACEESGLSLWLSCQLAGLKVIPNAAIVFIICTMLTFLTEITSNTATATILLPVLASLAQSIEVNPLYLMVPATVCASFAFMLPVATPPNAIVFATGRLSVIDMAKAGFGMNIIGIIMVTLSINTWGYAYYDLGNFPTWASVGSNVTSQCGGNIAANSTTPFFNGTTLTPTTVTF